MDSLSSTQLNGWIAYFRLEEKERQQSALSDEASANLAAMKGRRA